MTFRAANHSGKLYFSLFLLSVDESLYVYLLQEKYW